MSVLQCGDVHPQPGRAAEKRASDLRPNTEDPNQRFPWDPVARLTDGWQLLFTMEQAALSPRPTSVGDSN